MKSEHKLLLRLQDCDVQIRELEDKLKAIPSEIALIEQKLTRLHAEDALRKQAFSDMEQSRRRLDVELKDLEAKLIQSRTKQISVKKPEEYEAVQAEIDNFSQKIFESEESQINLLDSIDRKAAENILSAKEAESKESDIKKQIDYIKKHKQQVDERLAELRTQFEASKIDIPVRFLNKYMQITKQVKKGPYLVPVLHGKCQGCHIKVSHDTLMAAKHEQEIVQCDSCSRLLYWPEDY